MMNMVLIYSFAVALFLTIALIPLLIRFSAQMQLMDVPSDKRKIHDEAIPRSGGLAIALGTFLPILFLIPLTSEIKGLLIGAVIIVIFGYLDDRHELNYKWKFLGQVIAVLAVMIGGVSISDVPFISLGEAPAYISYPLTFFFILGVTNAVNLSDGLDGLAAGTVLFSLALISVFALKVEYEAVALIALTMIGGVLGFLRYNTFPARIFMGDAGSQFLGFIAASLTIVVTQYEASALSPVVPLLILGLPILDTVTVIFIRLREGRSPFSPDKNHLHHQLIALGFKHYEAVALIYTIQFVLIAGAYLLCYESDALLLAGYIGFCAAITLALYVGKASNWRFKGRHEIDRPQINRRNALFRRLNWVYLYSPVIIEWAMALFLVGAALILKPVNSQFAITALILTVVFVVMAYTLKVMSQFNTRLFCYSASVFVAYFLTKQSGNEIEGYIVYFDGFLIAFTLFLMLAIRMTRREMFRLDTQDLLILLMVVLVPQLPFAALDNMSIAQIALRLAVLMYGCEFLLGRRKNSYKIIKIASIFSLGLIGISAIYF
jgi:UDP-GlcNAc:undecaprenyl-phosphate GlcNAc-1-phosphate transferase